MHSTAECYGIRQNARDVANDLRNILKARDREIVELKKEIKELKHAGGL
jgi:hypothetical protein